MRSATCSLIVLMVLLTAVSSAWGQRPTTEGDPVAGQEFALHACTPCHVVSPNQTSPSRPPTAYSFEAIANTRAMTASALHAFLSNPHPTMPSLALDRQDEKNVIAYILSLKH